jgi:hypothetical protein
MGGRMQRFEALVDAEFAALSPSLSLPLSLSLPPQHLSHSRLPPCVWSTRDRESLRPIDSEMGDGPFLRHSSIKPVAKALGRWAHESCMSASLAQLVEHALRKRMVVGSIPTGGYT